MKYLILLVALLSLSKSVQATVQRADLIIHSGTIYRLNERTNKQFPLEVLWKDFKSRPKLTEGPGGMMSSACHRGYVAIWMVEDDTLFLLGLDAWQGDKKADLKILFPKRFKDGKAKADWFTGKLNLSKSFGLDADSGVLNFKNGKLIPNKKDSYSSDSAVVKPE